MKKLTLAMFAAAMLTLVSCNETARLAEKVEGTWSSAPVALANDVSGQSTTTETFMFSREQGTPGGTLTIQSAISQMRPASQANTFGPFAINVSAVASVQGTWKAIDDDEVKVNLDMNTLEVNVDPDAVDLKVNPLSGAEYPQVDSIKPQVVSFLTAELTGTMTTHYARYNGIIDTDFKDKGQSVEIEIGKLEILLHKQ